MFSRSYKLVSFTLSKRGNTSKSFLRNISRNSRLLACSATDTPKQETETIDKSQFERLSNDKHAQNALTIKKVDNEDETPHKIEFLDINKNDLNHYLDDIDIKVPGPLDTCDEDLSHIGPSIKPTYNFAKYVDKSETLQELVKLGVELYKLERDREILHLFLNLDFNKHIKPYIEFLNNCGVLPERFGHFITKNPTIFKEDMDDLHTRIRYLKAHNFSENMIQCIVDKHPPWLSFDTKELDRRLGHFQSTFKLSGFEVRMLSVKCPKLITYNMDAVKHSTFCIKTDMGFSAKEMKQILLLAPRVWIRARINVLDTFDYFHNSMGLSHEIISQQPNVLLYSKRKLKQRHEYLLALKRNQYDPRKPLYVSPLSLVTGTDSDFCKNIAKTSLETYELYLKML